MLGGFWLTVRRFLLSKMYYLLIVLLVFYLFIEIPSLRGLTADGSLYLNIAENIVRHKGYVVSYNLYQAFNTIYHPVWSYCYPLYPIFCSLFIKGGLEGVIRVNIVLLGINTAFIAYILDKVSPHKLNILFIASLVFTFGYYHTAFFPWTEQFHLFCFLLTFIFFLRCTRQPFSLFVQGAVNAVLMLVKAAHLFNYLAYFLFLLILRQPTKEKMVGVFSFVAGFVFIYGGYLMYCWQAYGTVYPGVASHAKAYTMAYYQAGLVYDSRQVGILIPSANTILLQHLCFIFRHIIGFVREMPYIVFCLIFFLVPPGIRKEGKGFVALGLLQAIFVVLGYSLSFYWLPRPVETLRYGVIPFLLMSMVGWYAFIHIYEKARLLQKSWVVWLCIWVCLLFQIHKFVIGKDNICALLESKKNGYAASLHKAFEWISEMTPDSALVASSEVQESYLMHRPFVSMPPGKSATCENIEIFKKIYKPDYFLLEKGIETCFPKEKYREIYTNKYFRVLKDMPDAE